MHIDDQTLIAYLDGQLPDSDYGPVEQALAESEALRERLQALVDSGEMARRSFDAVLLEPVPPSLIAAIWRAPDPRAHRPPPGGAARPASPWLWRFFGASPRPRVWPVLASVVLLAVGAVLSWQVLQTSEDVRWSLREGQPVVDPSLALALEVFVLGSPFLLQWVVDDVVVSNDRDLLLTLGRLCAERCLQRRNFVARRSIAA